MMECISNIAHKLTFSPAGIFYFVFFPQTANNANSCHDGVSARPALFPNYLFQWNKIRENFTNIKKNAIPKYPLVLLEPKTFLKVSIFLVAFTSFWQTKTLLLLFCLIV